MSAPDRIVRRLRLRAGSEEEIGRVLPRVEDALRCASLPDAGGRILVVRKLDLGRIDADASAQTLSGQIELRMAEAGVQWVHGGTAAAANAGFVSFADGLQARTQLALRLVRGEPCTEWYWPLAVPEFRTVAGSFLLLRSMAEAIARLPEARAALPAWTAAVVAAGGSARLLAAIDENTGEALLRQSGIAFRSQAVDTRRLNATAPEGLASGSQSRTDGSAFAGPGENVPPCWLRALLMAAGVTDTSTSLRPPLRANGTLPRQLDARAVSIEKTEAGGSRHEAGEVSGVDAPAPNVTTSLPLRSPMGRNALDGDVTGASAPTAHARFVDGETAGPGRSDPLPGSLSAALTKGAPYLEPTVCAGLLFLLPVLDRLGVDAWSTQAGPDGERFAHRVLMAALRCVGVAPDDPVWTLMPIDLDDNEPLAVPAPSSWRDALLHAPHARRAEGELGEALRLAESADAQASVWLRAARRWLRRAGRMGLATLVLRPGFISSTPTHVDIHFRVDDTDMRVRRAGLDLDPGWLPWFGRVVSFHYSERRP